MFRPFTGIVWTSIICIPFGLIVILLITGVIAIETIIFVGIALSVTLFILVFVFPHPRKHNKQDNQLLIPATNVRPLHDMKTELKRIDNGGNRTGLNRRIYEYSACIPERRSGRDRRKGFDRRNLFSRRSESERRQVFKT